MPDRLIPSIDGKRGSFLFIISLAYIALGIGQAFFPSPGQVHAFAWLPVALNHDEFGHLMSLAGVAGAIYSGAFSKAYPKLEGATFNVMIVLPALWGLVHIISLFFGNLFGLPLAMVYLFWSAVVFHVSGWPNPIIRDKRIDL